MENNQNGSFEPKQEITDLSTEPAELSEARAVHASEIANRLGNSNNNDDNNFQLPMEFSAKISDVINDLIKINNDRVAGFEKAASDLNGDDSGLINVFTRLSAESEQYAAELADISLRYGTDPAEGTSTSGDLHRAWIDIKSVFTDNDREAILNECERGEDAAKAAYRDALDPENEISGELLDVLQRQQYGISQGHDLIKSLRDIAAETEEDEDEDNSELTGTAGQESAYEDSPIPVEPAYTNPTMGYQQESVYTPEPETVEQEEAWEDDQVVGNGESKLMEFFIDELKDLLWAERELVETLPEMVDAATSAELKSAFQMHLNETEIHVSRLEQIFGILGLEPESRKCEAMAGILDEGEEIISITDEGTAQRDVGLIFAGQKAEHYEIASYGGMIALAKTLGYYDIAEILVLTIDEEKSADAKLTDIAEGHANYEASIEPAED